ncbi:MAG TPA: transglutaminaseTgpA domain-containing protein [Longimicrobiaceae bacterium]|jgi:transglutaminase-like putative cysteine protease|nr:transglutaminaseTgpA domain-containing protein [Longimicrobiaceae bacterium]
MRLALLHRRLCAGMALAALGAFAAGAGPLPMVLASTAGLGLALFWHPDARGSVWVERASRLGVLALCAWMLYVAFVLVADFMPAVLAMLLFLLVAESLRSLDARNDMRLYSLSFALLIAATAYYPGVGFAGAFVAYVVLATVGMMVGYLRRQAERFHVADIRVGRPFLAATVALSGVTVLVSVVLFVIFPRLPRQWNVHGRAGAGGEVMAGFGDEVSIGEYGDRISPNPTVAFRAEMADGRHPPISELYWRGRSFDRFDGTRWSSTPGLPQSTPAGWEYRAVWGGPPRVQRIYGGPPGARVLFGLHPVVEVRPRSAIRTLRDGAGDVVFFGSDEPVYSVVSAAARPPDAMLAASSDAAPPEGTPYLQLPPLPARISRLADSLTAGQATRLAKVQAVQRWLMSAFTYTLDLPANPEAATLDAFLFRRRSGHCEYFSSALTVLLREEGIPARSVTGFLGGEWNPNGDYLVVTGNDAHAWTEVWFPDVGWVPFDATPQASRSEALRRHGSDAWAAPARFWLDGLEHRWTKWVLDYNLDRQLGLLRDAGDFFSGSRNAGPRRTGKLPRPSLPVVLGVCVALAAIFWLLRRRPRAHLTPEARTYVALRRAYERAGYPCPPGETPLAFAERLRAANAPGAEDAARLIDLYLRARFAGQQIGDAGRAEMEAAMSAVRAELRASRRDPRLVAR